MTNPLFRKSLLSVVISAAVMSACSSDGSGSASTTVPDDSTAAPIGSGGSTTESSTSDGRITGFGSVIVNGVHFDVDSANILHDGVPITEKDLKVGMIVRLSGSVDGDGVNGTATEIEFDEEVKGPVSSIDLAGSGFVVLGQTVLVDGDTVFDKTTLDTLAVGNLVEVSGYFDADGALRATLVEMEKAEIAADEEVEVKGVVSLHNAATKQFMLRNLLVDYSSAELSDFPDDVISDGMLVEVKANAGATGDALSAVEVEYEERDKAADSKEEGKKRTVEGLVTAISSLTEFTVNGQSVLLTDSTEFAEGTAENIYLNTKIKVEGEFNAEGQLVAKEVKLQRRGDTKLEAIVDSVNTEAGTLTVFGTSVRITPTTVWEDESADDDQFISLAALASGDRVKIRGYRDADGVLVATAVERKDSEEDDEFELEGPVSNIMLNSSFTVMGVTVSFDAGTEIELDNDVTLEQFFTGLVEGDEVKVEGVLVSSTELTATSIELKVEDGRDEFGGDPSRGLPDADGDDPTEDVEGGADAPETDEADEVDETGTEADAPSSDLPPDAANDEQDETGISI